MSRKFVDPANDWTNELANQQQYFEEIRKCVCECV